MATISAFDLHQNEKEKNYQEQKNPLNYKTSWKINVFFFSHIFLPPFSVRLLINELRNCFISYTELLRNNNSFLVWNGEIRRYLNFYTQLI
jgi:hypothetical protein